MKKPEIKNSKTPNLAEELLAPLEGGNDKLLHKGHTPFSHSGPDQATKWKAIKGATININGLADVSKLYKLYQLFVSNNTDLMFIQEVRKLCELKGHESIKKHLLYCTERGETQNGCNGVAILYNGKRFTLVSHYLTPQLIIAHVEDGIDQRRILLINVYINPTTNKQDNIEEIKQEITQALSIACINKLNVIIAGDFNHLASTFRTLMKSYGINLSKVGPTRIHGRKEIDIIGSNFEQNKFSTIYEQTCMSDHIGIINDIRTKGDKIERGVIRTYRKRVKEFNDIPGLIERFKQLDCWGQLGDDFKQKQRLKHDYKFSSKYIDVGKKLLRNEIPVLSLKDKIHKIGSLNKDFTSELWGLMNKFAGDMTKLDAGFLQGVRYGEMVTFDSKRVAHFVKKHYSNKFYENSETRNRNQQTIKRIFEQYLKTEEVIQLLDEESLKATVIDFPVKTTHGIDMILPTSLKGEEVMKEVIKLTHKFIKNEKGEIPKDMLTGRLLLLTKSGGPVAPIDKTRPIAVQSLPVRLIEKTLKRKLENGSTCVNLIFPKYQCGFQPNGSTLVNTLRMKLAIKSNKKRRKKNRLIIFALDIASAFDQIPRGILLKAIEKRIGLSNSKNGNFGVKMWAFSTQLIKNREVVYDNDLEARVKIYSGVPQGGVMSPIFFNITLDYILRDINEEINRMVCEGRIMAYADDLVTQR